MTLSERAAAEVVAVHHVFVEILTGRGGAAALADAMSRMAADFTRVAPDATVQDRAAVEAMLGAGAGKVAADFAITITIEEAREPAPGTAVVRYREDQATGGTATSRRSTALFVDTDDGVRWSALQETWIGTADRGATTRGEADT